MPGDRLLRAEYPERAEYPPIAGEQHQRVLQVVGYDPAAQRRCGRQRVHLHLIVGGAQPTKQQAARLGQPGRQVALAGLAVRCLHLPGQGDFVAVFETLGVDQQALAPERIH